MDYGCYHIDPSLGLATFQYKRSQLLYDIDNICFIEGETLPREEYQTTQNIQDVAQKGNVDHITRILDLCVAKCREILYPFTKKDLFRPFLDNTFEETQEYIFFLSLPEGFSQTTLDYIFKLIHEYIVDRAVWEWLSIVNPGKRDIWKEKWEEVEMEIRRNLKARTSRLRRKSHPF